MSPFGTGRIATPGAARSIFGTLSCATFRELRWAMAAARSHNRARKIKPSNTHQWCEGSMRSAHQEVDGVSSFSKGSTMSRAPLLRDMLRAVLAAAAATTATFVIAMSVMGAPEEVRAVTVDVPLRANGEPHLYIS
jgi:hypothetical protein